MMVHPEDLDDVFDDDDKQVSDVLIEVRRIYRESCWCLTPQEEGDLIPSCRDLGELCITIFVYDLKRVPPTPN